MITDYCSDEDDLLKHHPIGTQKVHKNESEVWMECVLNYTTLEVHWLEVSSVNKTDPTTIYTNKTTTSKSLLVNTSYTDSLNYSSSLSTKRINISFDEPSLSHTSTQPVSVAVTDGNGTNENNRHVGGKNHAGSATPVSAVESSNMELMISLPIAGVTLIAIIGTGIRIACFNKRSSSCNQHSKADFTNRTLPAVPAVSKQTEDEYCVIGLTFDETGSAGQPCEGDDIEYYYIQTPEYVNAFAASDRDSSSSSSPQSEGIYVIDPSHVDCTDSVVKDCTLTPQVNTNDDC